MEKKPPKPMTPFDELLTSPKLQMLKLFLPYTPDSNQQFLGVFIKFMELEHTISFFQNSRTDLHNQAFQNGKPPSPAEMLKDLKPYMPPQQSEMMDTFLNMMNIMEMASTFQENSQGQTEGDFAGGLNPMDMMMGMLTPDQQNMYQMYNSMFSDSFSGKDTGQNTPDKDSSTDEGFVKESSVQGTVENEVKQDAAGGERSGQGVAGNERSGQGAAGRERSGQGAAGRERSGQGATGDERSGQGAAGDERFWQDAAGDERFWQDAAGDERFWQGTAENERFLQVAAGSEEPRQDAASDHVTNIEGDDTHEQLDEPSGNEEY